MKYDLLIIGGVAAGTSAGAAAKRQDRTLDVLIVQKERFISYGGCGLPYYIEGVVDDINSVIEFTPEKFREKKGVEVMTEHEVFEVDFEKKLVHVISLKTGDKFSIEWKKLIVSTGASAIVPPKFDSSDPRIFTIRNPEDAMRIREFLESRKPREALIIGGGYIGLEMSESISAHGVRVHIVEMLDRLAGAEPEINEVLKEELISKGVNVLLSTEVKDIEPGERIKVITSSGDIEVDMVLIAIGVKPNTDIFTLEKGVKGAIKVDAQGRTNVPDVFAAGDCATVKNLITGEDVYIPMGTTANKQGRVAGRVAAGGLDRFEGVLGSAITKVFNLEYGRTGLTESEARSKGFDAKSVYIKALSKAGYYPGTSPVHIKLVFDRRTGRILGAQMIGGGIHRRIDVLAVAIRSGISVVDLGYMDLAYAPPFSPVWDPVLISGNVARREL